MTETQSLPECLASGFAQAMATHSPLSAVLAEAAGFEALWLSGFEVSALYGLADVSLLTMSEHLALLRAISARCTIPIIADIDTGYGNAVRSYERAGAAAVVIEDRTFPKVTSLIDDGRQELLRREEFAGKIEAACSARQSEAFVIIARTEALIAGLGQAEALAPAPTAKLVRIWSSFTPSSAPRTRSRRSLRRGMAEGLWCSRPLPIRR